MQQIYTSTKNAIRKVSLSTRSEALSDELQTPHEIGNHATFVLLLALRISIRFWLATGLLAGVRTVRYIRVCALAAAITVRGRVAAILRTGCALIRALISSMCVRLVCTTSTSMLPQVCSPQLCLEFATTAVCTGSRIS